ncbi:MAG: hypothetical protein ACRCTZ_18270 [Sarcina sp.]
MSTIKINKGDIIAYKEYNHIMEVTISLYKSNISKLFSFGGYRELTYDEISDLINNLGDIHKSNINIFNHIKFKEFIVIDISTYNNTPTYLVPSDYHIRRQGLIITGTKYDKHQLIDYLSNQSRILNAELRDKSANLKEVNDIISKMYCDVEFSTL